MFPTWSRMTLSINYEFEGGLKAYVCKFKKLKSFLFDWITKSPKLRSNEKLCVTKKRPKLQLMEYCFLTSLRWRISYKKERFHKSSHIHVILVAVFDLRFWTVFLLIIRLFYFALQDLNNWYLVILIKF